MEDDYPGLWHRRVQAITAASGGCSTRIRFVRAAVPLPTDVAWLVTTRASGWAENGS
jgi:hypothetical protein